ncbi:hypothetical protein VKT23_017348 [Stygiomarasmius scandens]|uniref:Uncharacterized protein n=1 Tax=Marasmiellus scandens TaxID=2682957 RepID=A0ABR1IS82_9AGAR
MSSDIVTIILDDYFLSPKAAAVNLAFEKKGWVSERKLCAVSYNSTCASVSEPSGTASLIVRPNLDAVWWSIFGRTPSDSSTSFKMTLITDVTRGATVEQDVFFAYADTAYQFFWTDFVNTDDFRNQTRSQEMILVFAEASSITLDYILLAVTNTTDLNGTTILADDANPEISWNGWIENRFTSPIAASGTAEVGGRFFMPQGNGTHSSDTEGDSFTFQFAGSSISVSGINPVQPGCVLGMDFTVDSITTSKTFFYDGSSFPGTPHFIYFENQSLEPGNHTLIATITLIRGNITASIDYLTYRPSFSTILDKPVFVSPKTPSQSALPSPTSPGQTSSNHKTHTGVIAGAAVGGVAAVVLLGLLLWWLHKLQKKEAQLSVDFIAEPFTIPNPIHPEHIKYAIPPQQMNFQVEAPGRKGLPARVVPVNILPIQQQLTELQSQRDALNQGLESLEMQSAQHSEVGQNGALNQGSTNIAEFVREMRTQVDGISREINRYVVPPNI